MRYHLYNVYYTTNIISHAPIRLNMTIDLEVIETDHDGYFDLQELYHRHLWKGSRMELRRRTCRSILGKHIILPVVWNKTRTQEL